MSSLRARQRIAKRAALSAGVIPAQAGTQDTSPQGSALQEALRAAPLPNAASVPSLRGSLGARLRGHDVP